MLATSSIVLLLSAVAVMAGPHQARARSHNDIAIARRVESDNSTFSLDKRADQFLNTEFTWYPTDTGPDACTGKNHLDSDYYVAMGYTQYGQGGCCGKQLSITANGKTATATCVDECATCPQYGQLDFTKDLFKFFTGGDLDVGVIHGSWSYVDGSDTTTTSTTHTTHTTTSTTHTTPTTTKAAPTTTSTEVTTKDTTSAHPPAEVTTKTTTSTHTQAKVTTTTSADESAPSDDGDDGECIDEDDGDDNEDADEDDGDCDDDDDTSSTTVPHTSTTPAKVVSTPKPTTIEAVAPSKPTTTEEPAAPASSKAAPASSTHTASPSPSSAKFSSAEKPSSPVATPSTTIAVVGNVATAPQSASDTQDTSVPDAINGGLGQGTSGAASLSASKVLVALAVVALAAVQL
ncbi:hypothetical protein C8F01DRAFT_1157005 [Mycena amicta]|nr:hypothetical protein C8F01DRAFT_1157005 [Mycena amicta]